MTSQASSLSDSQLVELLSVLSASDSVELKLTVPESQQRSTVAALGMDPLEAQIRQVVFFDTPDLALDKGGVVVRARRVQGKGDDSVVKLRPVVPSELSDDVRAAKGFTVEVDALPGGFVCSGHDEAGARSGRGQCESRAGRRDSPLQALFEEDSGRSSRRTRRRASSSTTSPCSGPSSCSSCGSRRPSSRTGSWRRCGSTPTARACSSSRRRRCPTTRSRLAARLRAFLATTASSFGCPADEDPQGARVLRVGGARRRVEGDARDDRPSVGMADIRRKPFAAGGGDDAPRRDRVTESDERYTCRRRRSVGEGPRELAGREAPRARRRQRSRAVAAGAQGAARRSASRMHATVLEALGAVPDPVDARAARARRLRCACSGRRCRGVAVHKTRRAVHGRRLHASSYDRRGSKTRIADTIAVESEDAESVVAHASAGSDSRCDRTSACPVG